MLTDKTVNTESMRSDSHVRVKLGCCIVSSRNSESCLFLLRHVQNSSWKWPEDSHMDIMPAFHYSFNFCICRICYRHEDTNRWGAVSFLCTLFLSRSLSLPRCLDFSHPGFLWQSQLKRRHWSGHRLRAPYLNRNFSTSLCVTVKCVTNVSNYTLCLWTHRPTFQYSWIEECSWIEREAALPLSFRGVSPNSDQTI